MAATQEDLEWAYSRITQSWYTCEACGVTAEDVFTDYDPYTLEIYDSHVLVTWCQNCFDQASNDI